MRRVGRGPGFWNHPREHRENAMRSMRGRPLRNERAKGKGSSTGGMYVTTYPTKKLKVARKEFEIPTGPDGKVPEEAIIARFLNEYEGDRKGGKRNIVIDSHDYAKVRLPPNPTPEQIKDWWAYPNESDVKNIDTPDANIFNIEGIAGKGSKEANQTIAIVGGTEAQRREVREAISTGFTVAEQKAMRGTTVYITDLKDAAGEYHGKSYGGSYLVKLDRRAGINPETVDHEMIHHLRVVDDKRDDPLVKCRPGYIGKDRDLEEAATVAETQARHKPFEFDKQIAYYSLLPESKTKKAEDRGLFTRKEVQKNQEGKVEPSANQELVRSGRKGKRAVRAVKDGFIRSNIGHLKITGGKAEAIDQYYRITGKDGHTVASIQVYSPQMVAANPRPRKGQKIYEYRDGKRVLVAGRSER